MKHALIILFCLSTLSSWTQQKLTSDTTIVEEIQPHNIKKATLMSAALPGLGQVYNRQAWKIPIVYAGLGVSAYFLNDNIQNFRHFKQNLLFEIDGDASTINETEFGSAQLTEITETYRRWRDLSYIAIAAVYLLNIMDANVSAHLFYFDVDDDLTLQWSPTVLPTKTAGISLQLQF